MVEQLLHAAAGIAGILALAWIVSERRRVVPWRAVVAGLLLQFALALILLQLPLARTALLGLNDGMLALEKATQAGTSFVFGYLGGGEPPFIESRPAASFILAFRALPLVLIISALSALLFYWRILPAIVRAVSWVLERVMGVGGVVGLATAANVFVGMVEAPLVVKPYLARVSRGELFAIMVCGMATISGTVLFLYASLLREVVPDAVGHLFVASILSAPAALVISFLMVPPQGEPTGGKIDLESKAENSMDALTRGTLDGLQLFLADRVRRARDAREPRHRALLAAGRRGLAAHAAGMARGPALGRGPHRRHAARHEDRAERARRVHGPGRHARSQRAQSRAHELRALRLRQLRLAGHHDRRARHHVPRAAW